MRLASIAAAILVCVAVTGAQQGVIYVPASRAATVMQTAAGGTLAATPELSVAFNKRTGPGEVEVHDRVTDTFHIIDGEATLVVGGTLVGGKTTEPGQQRGTSITGGQTFHLVKGDVVVIPAGLPHWFKEVPHSVVYYTVKVIRP
jgi:mannose-6-phosphate isomerase-like protein (cupin superfamily)